MMFCNSGFNCSKLSIEIYLVLFLTILLSEQIFGQSADIRAAFCLDYTAHIPGSYEKKKAYNQCFYNAKTLIKEYEESKKKGADEARVWLREAAERSKQREEESRLERERKNQEYVRRSKAEQIEAEKEKERIERKFDAF